MSTSSSSSASTSLLLPAVSVSIDCSSSCLLPSVFSYCLYASLESSSMSCSSLLELSSSVINNLDPVLKHVTSFFLPDLFVSSLSSDTVANATPSFASVWTDRPQKLFFHPSNSLLASLTSFGEGPFTVASHFPCL